MIYTLTLSPAVDLIIKLHNECEFNVTNRAYEEVEVPGGKGINVSRTLKSLGVKSVAVGFVGGYTGKFLEDSLKNDGIKTDFVYLDNPTRINVKLLVDKSDNIEINAPSPAVSKNDIMNIVKKFAKLKKTDIVVISGSLPKDFPLNLFDDLLKILHNKKILFVLDISGKLLLRSLKYHPFLIKPNQSELSETLYIDSNNLNDVNEATKRLVKMGAQNVIVSLGKNGAIFANSKSFIEAKPIKGEVINAAGAGDSLIAGFIAEYLKSENYEKAFKQSIIVASATAFSTDIATNKQINEIKKSK